MLSTAAQHKLTVTTSLQRLPHLTIPQIRLPRRQIAFTTWSAILFSTTLESSCIQSIYCSIQCAMKYQSISAWFVQIDGCGKVPVTANRHFGHSISWRGRWVSTPCSCYKGVPAAQIAKFTGPAWSPSGFCWPHMGPMLAPWTLLLGWV